MRNIIIFIEPSDKEYETPLKIGRLYWNRFAIDENAAFEILGVYEIKQSLNQGMRVFM